MCPAAGEFKMILHAHIAKKNSVEAVVILETAENFEFEPFAVHRTRTCKVADWTCNADMIIWHIENILV